MASADSVAEYMVGAGVDGGLTELIHLICAGSGVGLHRRHAGVEVRRHPDSGHAQRGGGDTGRRDAGGDELRFASGGFHGGRGLLAFAGHFGHAGGEIAGVREQADGDVAVQATGHGISSCRIIVG